MSRRLARRPMPRQKRDVYAVFRVGRGAHWTAGDQAGRKGGGESSVEGGGAKKTDEETSCA